ncbi:MAG: hypothetical protein IJ053_00585 [Lachnospiraceae bacterium]|nr:hypothetical protein [Lachnospiraceae bacterium]
MPKKEVKKTIKVNDESKKAETKRQINNLSNKINQADDVRARLLSYKNILDTYIDDFNMTRDKLTGEYLDIKTIDVFEGEMAESLSEYVSDVAASMSHNIAYATAISSSLQAQIDSLGTYISGLKTEQSSLRISLY